MDPSVKKLLKNLQELEFKRSVLGRDIDAIRRSLEMLGLKVEDASHSEGEYAARRPFKRVPLTEACLVVLKDHKEHWLTKSQIEYLIARGGYEFSAKDTGNSVDVTLRRLATAGKCEAERVRGSTGNRYRYRAGEGPAFVADTEEKDAVENSGATKPEKQKGDQR